MYAFQLPAAIPQAGTPGGPPVHSDWRNFGGFPGEADFRDILWACIRDPQQLRPTWDRMQAQFEAEAQKNKNKGKK
jgi:hypothetical protein